MCAFNTTKIFIKEHNSRYKNHHIKIFCTYQYVLKIFYSVRCFAGKLSVVYIHIYVTLKLQFELLLIVLNSLNFQTLV